MEFFEVLLGHEVTIYGPPTAARDSGGGVTLTWPTARTSGVKCVLNVSGANSQDRFSQDQLVGPVTAAMLDTSVRRGDKLTVTAGPTLVGTSFHVTGVKTQPGLDFLGISEVCHVTLEQIL